MEGWKGRGDGKATRSIGGLAVVSEFGSCYFGVGLGVEPCLRWLSFRFRTDCRGSLVHVNKAIAELRLLHGRRAT